MAKPNKTHTSGIMFIYSNLLHVLCISCCYLQGGDTEVKKLKADTLIEVPEPIQNIK